MPFPGYVPISSKPKKVPPSQGSQSDPLTVDNITPRQKPFIARNLNSNIEEFTFKKTFFGNLVLYVRERKPSVMIGEFIPFWRKATELEAHDILTEYKRLVQDYNQCCDRLEEIKEKSPEMYL